MAPEVFANALRVLGWPPPGQNQAGVCAHPPPPTPRPWSKGSVQCAQPERVSTVRNLILLTGTLCSLCSSPQGCPAPG